MGAKQIPPLWLCLEAQLSLVTFSSLGHSPEAPPVISDLVHRHRALSLLSGIRITTSHTEIPLFNSELHTLGLGRLSEVAGVATVV